MKPLIAAFRFLTALPLPGKTQQCHLEKSMVWFPLVGVLTGLVTGFGYWLCYRWFSEAIGAALAISFYIIFTRGLHLDGFMDTIDGFFSHRDREAVLRIMKDPNVGSFAILGAGIWFLVLFSALPHLTVAHHVLIQVCTRMAVLLPPLSATYPRESGTGRFFVENVTARTFSSALILTVLLLVATYVSPLPGGATGVPVLRAMLFAGCLLVALLLSWLTGKWAGKKIGGVTGDVLGFAIETNHLVLVLMIAATSRFLPV